MKISSTPENYSGAFADVIYTITDAIPEQTVEVTVLGETTADVLGMKRFKGLTAYDVNIANYIRRRMCAEPVACAYSRAYIPEGRLARARIKVGTAYSPLQPFISGCKGGALFEILSDAPFGHSIARGEIDEMALIGSGEEQASMYAFLIKEGTDIRDQALAMTAQADNMLVFQINANEVASRAESLQLGGFERYSHLEVCLETDGRMKPVRSYAIRPSGDNHMRMCWVNPYGALDYYTFARTGPESVVAEKKKVYTEDGYKCCGSQSEKYYTLASGYENSATIEWLSGIICSPKVWIYRDGTFTEVDIVTSNATSDKMAPTSISLMIRKKKRTVYQNF